MPAGAAGTGYTTDFSTIADRSNEVNEGDKIRFISNGGADNSTVGCMLNARHQSGQDLRIRPTTWETCNVTSAADWHQFLVSGPGVFLVGSGVSGLVAPVFLEVSFGGLAFASFGVTPGVLSEPGAPGSTGFSALTGVPARTSIATAKAIAACLIWDLLGGN